MFSMPHLKILVKNCRKFAYFTRLCKASRRINDENVQCIYQEEEQSCYQDSFLGNIYAVAVCGATPVPAK